MGSLTKCFCCRPRINFNNKISLFCNGKSTVNMIEAVKSAFCKWNESKLINLMFSAFLGANKTFKRPLIIARTGAMCWRSYHSAVSGWFTLLGQWHTADTITTSAACTSGTTRNRGNVLDRNANGRHWESSPISKQVSHRKRFIKRTIIKPKAQFCS